MINRIVLIGRLTRDPEPRVTPSGVPVTTFSIAVDRPQSSESRQAGREKETDFIDIVTWRQTAEFAANYLQKGRLVGVDGRLQIRSYVTQDGQQRKAAEVVADNVRPLDKPRDGTENGEEAAYNGGGGGGYEQRPAAAAPAARGGGYDRGSGGGGGGYERSGGAAPAAGRSAPPAGGNRGRNTPPPANDFDGMDDISDPFAE